MSGHMQKGRKGGESYCLPCEEYGLVAEQFRSARERRFTMKGGGSRRRVPLAVLMAMGTLLVFFFAATVVPQPLAPKPHYLGVKPDLSASSVSGVRVSAINPGSPAEKAGLQVGDVIVKLGTVAIENPEDLIVALKSPTPGTPVEVIYLRQGKECRTQVTLEGRR